MLVYTFVTLATLMAASASPLQERDETLDPNQAVIDAWLADTSNTTTLIIGSSFYTKEATNGLDKRDCIPSRFTNNNVDRTGTWWSSWSKVSGCRYNTLSSGSASLSYTTSQTITKTISGGFDFGLSSPEEMAKTINGNGGLNFGYSWSTSKTTGTTWTCNVNAGDKASVWQQNLMGWADTAQRHCTRGCGEGTWCSDWEFGHIDFPLSGDNTVNFGCSSGANAQC